MSSSAPGRSRLDSRITPVDCCTVHGRKLARTVYSEYSEVSACGDFTASAIASAVRLVIAVGIGVVTQMRLGISWGGYLLNKGAG